MVYPHSNISLEERSTKKVRWGTDNSEEDTEEEEAGEEEESQTVDNNKIYLAAFCQQGRVGCAYYDPIKCSLCVMEDTQDTSHYDLVEMLLDHANPDVVLTSFRADDSFIDLLQDHTEGVGGSFQIKPHKDFHPAKGRDRLLSLPLLSALAFVPDTRENNPSEIDPQPRNAYDFMRKRKDACSDPIIRQWNASIRLSNFTTPDSAPHCMASVGALLDHMVRERAAGALEDDGVSELEIRGIDVVALDQVMQINADALFSLQIFEDESHASVHSDKTKEGLSLFATLNYTKTSLGRSLLRTWLLRPSLSLTVISSRHDAVECFLRTENIGSANAMHGHLKGIKNVPKILAILKSGKGKLSDWQGVVRFTFHSALLRDALSELHHTVGIEIIIKLTDALDIAGFRDVGSMINSTIDWEESALAGRICVRPHIDEELDHLKHVYHGIDGVLSAVAEQICQTVPVEYATSLNVVYFPQLGFLICTPMLDDWKAEAGINVLEGWSFQFSSDSHVYFKSPEMRDMDQHIGDLHPLIVDREIDIIQTLLERVLEYDEAVGRACDVCAELDCLLSFAEAARAYDYRRPEMVEECVTDIIQGRHPLQEQVVSTFVPNDARLLGGLGRDGNGSTFDGSESIGDRDGRASPWNSVVLCTGANACGKSIYLKQIALIHFMAQIGSFVPAELATLGIVDKIFTRIQTRESVSKTQSAFMIDLNQVSLGLRNATSRSLILLDEFGKGTLATDGAGLLCGVLKSFMNRGNGCPRVLVATHFHEIFRHDLLDPETMPITFLHMKVMFASDDGEILEEEHTGAGYDLSGDGGPTKSSKRITYLYRVAQGLSLASHAAQCAQVFGIPRRLAKRAEYVTQLISTHELGQLLDEDMTVADRAELEECDAICRRFLAWDMGVDGRVTGVKENLAKVLGWEVDKQRG